MVDEIVREIRQYEAETALDNDEEGFDDDDLDDLLGDLGISRT